MTKTYIADMQWQSFISTLPLFLLPAFVFFGLYTGIELYDFYSNAKDQECSILWIIGARYGLGWNSLLTEHEEFKEAYTRAMGIEEKE